MTDQLTLVMAQLAAAEARIAQLTADLTFAEAHLVALETRFQVGAVAHVPPVTVVTRFTDRAGRDWIKTRTGNHAVSCLA